MKKALGGITFLLLALILASPWLVGSQIETYYDKLLVDATNQAPTLEIKDYTFNRGWFTSTVTGAIGIKGMPETEEIPVEVRFESTVIHGPVFWKNMTSGTPVGLALDKSRILITPDAKMPEEIKEGVKKIPAIAFESVVNFQRNIITKIQMDTYTGQFDKEGSPVAIDFQGIAGSSTYTPAAQEIAFNLTMPQLTIIDEKGEAFTMKGLALTGQGKGNEGNVRYALENITLKNRDAKINFSLDKAYLGGGNAQADDVYNAFLEAGFATLKADEETFAPAELLIAVENLDKASLDTLKDSLNETMTKSDEMGQEMLGMVVMGKLMEVLPDLLKQNPKIIIKKLNLGTGENTPLTASGYATVIGEKAVKLMASPMIIQAVDAQVEALLPKKFTISTMGLEKLARLVDQQILIPDGDVYRLRAQVKEGHININGTTIM
ncbi:MAG: YdgA family protein [Desulfobacterales bacterium]|nr:YdgA family protein [Desulfobacterales bacterium]